MKKAMDSNAKEKINFKCEMASWLRLKIIN